MFADTTDFSRVEFQLRPKKNRLAAADTTDFSRVEFQFRPNQNRLATADTTDFSRVETQFLPKGQSTNKWPKLKLHGLKSVVSTTQLLSQRSDFTGWNFILPPVV